MEINEFKKILAPNSIAVVGASIRKEAVGSIVLNNLINSGFKGKIYPVNPKYKEINGLECYVSIKQIEQAPELVVLVIPSSIVLQVLDDCHEIGVKNVLIISAGFKEVGNYELEEQFLKKLKEYDIHAIGPNSVGIMNTYINMNCSFSSIEPQGKGSVALVTQSGALGCGIVNLSKHLNNLLAYMISVGNQSDLNVIDVMEYLEQDENVKQIMLYLESIPDTIRFREVTSRIVKTKPIICIKAGRTIQGSKSATSHTGALACNDILADEFLFQCGILRADTVNDMIIMSHVLKVFPNIKGNNIAILTNGGGPAILATDSLSENEIDLMQFNAKIEDKIKSILYPLSSTINPIDMTAMATVEHYEKSIKLLLSDGDVDILLLIHLKLMGITSLEIAEKCSLMQTEHPNQAIINVFITDNDEFNEIRLKYKNLLCFKNVEDAITAIKTMQKQKLQIECRNSILKKLQINDKKVMSLIQVLKEEKRTLMSTFESLELLNALKINTCEYCLATNAEMARQFAQSVGYPVAIKLSSKTITHKSDIGGVVLNLNNEKELTSAYVNMNEMLKTNNLLDGFEGILVEKMVKSKREFACGLLKDKVFNQCLMFGVGGIFIEAINDIKFKIIPLSECDLTRLIKGIRAQKLLNSVRGTSIVDIEELKNTLRALSSVANYLDIEELDINPLLVDDITGKPYAVDCRVILKAE